MAKHGLDKVNGFEDVSGVTCAVLCLSRSWAVSKQSESLCCLRASLLLSLSFFIT